jgi:DNA-binding LytR/AlgR family response regulator
MSILSSTKAGVKSVQLTEQDFIELGFQKCHTGFAKSYNGKIKYINKKYTWQHTTLKETDYYAITCSINGKTYNIPITNIISLQIAEDIFTVKNQVKQHKLKKKLYKLVYGKRPLTTEERKTEPVK